MIVSSHIPISETTTSVHVSLVKGLAPCQMLPVLVIVVANISCALLWTHCHRSRGSHFRGNEYDEVEETL